MGEIAFCCVMTLFIYYGMLLMVAAISLIQSVASKKEETGKDGWQ